MVTSAGTAGCPATGIYACDELGCYSYVPFDMRHVELDTYPRVAEVPVHTATVHAGDAFLIPSFWMHYITHLPRDGGGRNVALTFVSQDERGAAEQLPFAADIVRRWRAKRRRGARAGPD